MTDDDQDDAGTAAETQPTRRSSTKRWWTIGLSMTAIGSSVSCLWWGSRPSTDEQGRALMHAFWGHTAFWWGTRSAGVAALAVIGLLLIAGTSVMSRFAGRARLVARLSWALVALVVTGVFVFAAMALTMFDDDVVVVTDGHDRVLLVDDSFLNIDGGWTVWVGRTDSTRFVQDKGSVVAPLAAESCRLERQEALVLDCDGQQLDLTPAGD